MLKNLFRLFMKLILQKCTSLVKTNITSALLGFVVLLWAYERCIFDIGFNLQLTRLVCMPFAELSHATTPAFNILLVPFDFVVSTIERHSKNQLKVFYLQSNCNYYLYQLYSYLLSMSVSIRKWFWFLFDINFAFLCFHLYVCTSHIRE